MTGTIEAEIPEETALYHVYGEADLLLYIGISNDFGRRWKEHAKEQPWWDEKRRLTADRWYDFRSEAEAAEASAIKAEQPKYNKIHAARPPEPEYLIEPGVPAPADMSGWLTVAEAATRYGRSEQSIYQAHKRGLLEGQRFWRTSLMVSEKDLGPWIAGGPKKKLAPAPFGLTDRQAEVLLDIYLKRYNPEYGMLIVTRRSLRKRGLIAAGNTLTTEGAKVARELHRQQLDAEPQAGAA